MLNFRLFVVLLTFLSGCVCVLSCQLQINGPSPLFTKDFGSKIIVFKARGRDVNLENNGETIQANCESEITVRNAYGHYIDISAGTTVMFTCLGNSISVNGNSYNEILQISCTAEKTLSLYESHRNLPKCMSYMNYAVGMKVTSVGDVIKIGVCYDFERLTLKFATYIADHKKAEIFDKHNAGSELSVDLWQNINGFKNYFNFIDQTSLEDLLNLKELPLNSNEFHLESLLQNEPLNTELQEYAYIFNILWWRQLRQENWRYFLDALHKRTHSAKYQVYIGSYGNITIPAAESNCSSIKSEVIAIRNEDMEVQAPAYIWAYLKSLTPGDTEEFVVIGHNSPYTINPGHNEFCEIDMCDEIDWLKRSQFGNLRRFPTFGYTFCCRAEEVAKIIDYLPLKDDDDFKTTTTKTLGITYRVEEYDSMSNEY